MISDNFQEFRTNVFWISSWTVFAPLSLFLLGVELEILFSTYFIIHVSLTPFHLNENYRKWRGIFWVRTWCFPTKLNIFHTNPKDNLTKRCHSKIILGHAVFQLLFESTFSLKLSLLLNSSIRWQWLLFHLIKGRGNYKQVIKFR